MNLRQYAKMRANEILNEQAPSKVFPDDFLFDATFGDNFKLNNGKRGKHSAEEVSKYLDQNAEHTVVLHGASNGPSRRKWSIKFGPELYVIRGGDDASPVKMFWWGEMPAEDPNDAEPADTAMDALWNATEDYWH